MLTRECTASGIWEQTHSINSAFSGYSSMVSLQRLQMLKQLTIAASPYHKNKPRNKNLGEKLKE